MPNEEPQNGTEQTLGEVADLASQAGTQVPEGDSDNGRWGEDKARVIGRAVDEDFLHSHASGELLDDMRKGEESYFERLYDMNPEHFGSMPTSEFIDVAKRLLALEAAAKTSKSELEEFSEKHGIAATNLG